MTHFVRNSGSRASYTDLDSLSREEYAMADIRAFRAFRYDLGRVGSLSDVDAPRVLRPRPVAAVRQGAGVCPRTDHVRPEGGPAEALPRHRLQPLADLQLLPGPGKRGREDSGPVHAEKPAARREGSPRHH